MSKANVLRGQCLHECSVTWHCEHGGALPDGPFPGTDGESGDVRRCEHGRLWLFTRSRENSFYCLMDCWRPINRWLEPRLYRKTQRLLAAPVDQEGTK